MNNAQKMTFTRLLMAFLAVFAVGVLSAGCRQYPSCKKDKHCAKYDVKREKKGLEAYGTPYCVDQTCRECRSDSNCGYCEGCNDGVCEPIANCCTRNDECEAPMVCRGGRCDNQCNSDADCPDRQRCQDNLCVAAECTNDSHCPQGQRCENYSCVARPTTVVEPCANKAFQPVYFDFDEYALTAAAQGVMDSNNMICFEKYTGNVKVEGHADERGTTEYNLALGEKRARAVRKYATDRDVPSSRLSTVSYGESRPASQGSTENAYRLNRRVELVWQ